MRRFLVLALTATAAVALLVPVSAAQAATPRPYCKTGGDGRTGTCWYPSPVKKHVKVVQATPLSNKSSRKATMHCSFSETITKSMSTGISTSAEVKAGLFHVVDVSTKIQVDRNVSQTRSEATEAGGSIVMPPHSSITCERTYGYVVSTVVRKEWSGSRTWKKKFSMTIPSALGVTLVD